LLSKWRGKVFKERIYRDKADANIIHDEITTIDHALTRPWAVDKRYMRDPDSRPVGPEYYIAEGNGQIAIVNENYFLNGEGVLMPAKKNQAPPDLRYFKQTARRRVARFTKSEGIGPNSAR
jgi:hypothetical protein